MKKVPIPVLIFLVIWMVFIAILWWSVTIYLACISIFNEVIFELGPLILISFLFCCSLFFSWAAHKVWLKYKFERHSTAPK